MSNSLDTLLEEDTYRVPERLPFSELPATNSGLPDLGSTPLFWPDFQSQEYWRAGSATADYSSGKDRNSSNFKKCLKLFRNYPYIITKKTKKCGLSNLGCFLETFFAFELRLGSM